MVCVLSSSGGGVDGEAVTRTAGGSAGAAGLAGVAIGFVAAGALSAFGFAGAAGLAAAGDSAARLMPESLTCTPLPTWNGVAGDVRGVSTRAGGGSEKVRSSVRTRMLLDVSGLLAGAAGAVAGLAAGFATTGGAAGFATTGGAAGFAAGAFAAILRAGCFAVSEVDFPAADFSGAIFAFRMPLADVFAIAASAAGVSDGGSQVNSSRPSVGATVLFAAGAGLAAFTAPALGGVSGSQVSSMTSESAGAAFFGAAGAGFVAACFAGAGAGACFATGAAAAAGFGAAGEAATGFG